MTTWRCMRSFYAMAILIIITNGGICDYHHKCTVNAAQSQSGSCSTDGQPLHIIQHQRKWINYQSPSVITISQSSTIKPSICPEGIDSQSTTFSLFLESLMGSFQVKPELPHHVRTKAPLIEVGLDLRRLERAKPGASMVPWVTWLPWCLRCPKDVHIHASRFWLCKRKHLHHLGRGDTYRHTMATIKINHHIPSWQ